MGETMNKSQTPAEIALRSSIREICMKTREDQQSIGQVIGISMGAISERQRGQVRWSVHELSLLAQHWQIPPGTLVTSPQDAVSSLPVERVIELRQAHKKRRQTDKKNR